jgi:hypothetical protein
MLGLNPKPPAVLMAVLKRLITMELKKPRTQFWYIIMTILKQIEPIFCYIGARVTIRAASDIKLGSALGSRVEIPNTQEASPSNLIISTLWPLWAPWMILRFHNHLFGKSCRLSQFRFHPVLGSCG